MSQNGPSTPSRLQAHSRHISVDGGTEFGTPDTNFPGELEVDSPTPGESTRMVGLGISRQGSLSAPSGRDGGLELEVHDDDGEGDVFGGFTSTGRGIIEREGRDRTLDEVDQFLQDEEDEQTLSLDHHDLKRSIRPNTKLEINSKLPRRNDSSHSSLQSPRSHASDPLLEVLDNDDYEDGDEGMEMLDGEDDEEFETGGGGAGRRSRRGRRRWNEDEGTGEAGLLELIPPLIIAHPLALFPILAYLPYNFLPAGVVFFIPVLSVLAVLSACAQIVIVYLSWYLKVSTFEEIFATVAGRYAPYGLWAGRAAIITSTLGMTVSWLGSLHPLFTPVVEAYLGHLSHRASRLVLTIVGSLPLLPSLLPSRMTRSLRRAPFVLALMLPIVAFIIVGRTVEIERDRIPKSIPSVSDRSDHSMDIVLRALNVSKKLGLGLSGTSSAGAGITTLTLFLSPHVCTLSTHSQLARAKRTSFPLPALASSLIVLLLSLPAALVPYYLMSTPTGMEEGVIATPRKSGVLARYPDADLSINVARCFMAAMVLGSCNMWILRGRDTILRSIGVDRGEMVKAGRWVGLGFWVIIVSLVCLGGWVSEKLEILGVIATISISWLLPAVFFIITFHVRSPLSIVFPSKNPPPAPSSELSTPSRSNSHARTDSMTDPTQDILLARKERQLQKRRLGRRLWQDLIVYIGILPVGCVTIAWGLGKLVGLW